MPNIPKIALPETWIVVDIGPKYEGKDVTRRIVGTQVKILLTLDHCAPVPITIRGLNSDTLPSPELVNDRNLKTDFLVARFQNLEISFSGGDYGAIRYRGTATGVEFLNLNTPPAQPHGVPAK